MYVENTIILVVIEDDKVDLTKYVYTYVRVCVCEIFYTVDPIRHQLKSPSEDKLEWGILT